MSRCIPFICALVALSATGADRAWSQARVNPDISAITDMRYVVRDDVAKSLAGSRSTSFEFEELELNYSAYLNPYSRADVFISTGLEGPVEIEEAYATVLRGLPVQARFGKYKLDMGKVNTQHPHQWGWLDTPLMLKSFFGHEGASAPAVNVSRLQPVGDTALTLSANAFQAGFFQHGHGDEADAGADSTSESADAPPEIGYSGRLSAFRSLTDFLHVEAGASYMFATYDPAHNLDAKVGCVDFKLKWRPDTYRSVTFVAEAMRSDREVEDETTEVVSNVIAYGAFSAGEVRFRKRFDVGGFIDWAQDALVDGVETTAGGGYFGFMPVEETLRFSAVYRHETSDLYDGSDNTVTVQVLWAVGPHKPHQF